MNEPQWMNEPVLDNKWLQAEDIDKYADKPMEYIVKPLPHDAVVFVTTDDKLYCNKYTLQFIFDGQKHWYKRMVSWNILDSSSASHVISMVIEDLYHTAVSHLKLDKHQAGMLKTSLNAVKAGGGTIQDPDIKFSIKKFSIPSPHEPEQATPAATINGKAVSDWADGLPGVQTYVNYPCNCMDGLVKATGKPVAKKTLSSVIIHLNDICKWSRDQIADWIDELADRGEINVDFPTPGLDDLDEAG